MLRAEFDGGPLAGQVRDVSEPAPLAIVAPWPEPVPFTLDPTGAPAWTGYRLAHYARRRHSTRGLVYVYEGTP